MQDRWTMDRVTRERRPAARLVQRQPTGIPPLPVAHHAASQLRRAAIRHGPQKDITPKLAAAWDVFGDGKTALKVNLSKYVLGQSLVGEQSADHTQQLQLVRRSTRDANLDGQQQQLHPGLRPHEPGGQGPTLAGSASRLTPAAP